METTFNIQGMHCASCKALIEDACRDVPGVTSCDVDMQRGTARIEHDAATDPEAIRREIERLGSYRASPV